MNEPSDFASAIAQAFEGRDQFEAALAVVRGLVDELDQAVAARTGGAIHVEAATESRARDFGLTLGEFLGLAGPPRLGHDQEDAQVRRFVVARTSTRAARALWEIEFSERGYPITIRGPETNASTTSTTCYSEEDVREQFLAAASHTRVGRKLAALEAEVGAALAGKPPLPETRHGDTPSK
jgi:hypothetical protein